MSWKTTAGGCVGAVCLIFVALKVWNSYLTGEPVDIDSLFSGMLGLAVTVIGFFGRDNNITSEEAGAK